MQGSAKEAIRALTAARAKIQTALTLLRRLDGSDHPQPADDADQINPSDIVWLGPVLGVGAWPKTSVVKAARLLDRAQTLEHSMAGKWPVVEIDGVPVEANIWVIARREGQEWHAATFEWMRPGQTVKSLHLDEFAEHIKATMFDEWMPLPGEIVGMMVSTPARHGILTIDQRSNIVLVTVGE